MSNNNKMMLKTNGKTATGHAKMQDTEAAEAAEVPIAENPLKPRIRTSIEEQKERVYTQAHSVSAEKKVSVTAKKRQQFNSLQNKDMQWGETLSMMYLMSCLIWKPVDCSTGDVISFKYQPFVAPMNLTFS